MLKDCRPVPAATPVKMQGKERKRDILSPLELKKMLSKIEIEKIKRKRVCEVSG